jgi:hypothetical protein
MLYTIRKDRASVVQITQTTAPMTEDSHTPSFRLIYGLEYTPQAPRVPSSFNLAVVLPRLVFQAP